MPTGRANEVEKFCAAEIPSFGRVGPAACGSPSHPGPGRVTSLGLQDPLFGSKRLQLQQGYETVE